MTIEAIKMEGFSAEDDGAGGEAFSFTNTIRTDEPPSPSLYASLLGVLDANGFAIGSPCTISTPAKCRKRSLRISKSERKGGTSAGDPAVWVWEAVCNFSRKSDNPGGPSSQKDPTLRLPKITVRQNKSTIPVLKDIDGNPVVNTAGDPMDRQGPDSKLIITIDKAVASFDFSFLRKAPVGYMHSRNGAAWEPFGTFQALFGNPSVPAGEASVEELTAEPVFDNGQAYVQLHGEIHVDDDDFVDRVWSTGYRGWYELEEKQSGYPLVQLLDPNTGSYAQRPLPLDEDGVLIVGRATDELYELRFQYRPMTDWSLLPLP